MSHLLKQKQRWIAKKLDWVDRDLAKLLMYHLLQPKVLLYRHAHEPFEAQDKINEYIIYN